MIGAMHGVRFVILSINGCTDGMGGFWNSWQQSIDVFSFFGTLKPHFWVACSVALVYDLMNQSHSHALHVLPSRSLEDYGRSMVVCR
jgi:hypothetical protein